MTRNEKVPFAKRMKLMSIDTAAIDFKALANCGWSNFLNKSGFCTENKSYA
jgi:hypothetical protein